MAHGLATGGVQLLALPEGRAFQEGLKTWMAEPPTSERLTVVSSYLFF
jgi:hypothetical protein